MATIMHEESDRIPLPGCFRWFAAGGLTTTASTLAAVSFMAIDIGLTIRHIDFPTSVLVAICWAMMWTPPLFGVVFLHADEHGARRIMILTLRDHGIIVDPDFCDRMDLKGSYRHALPIILAVEWRYEDQTTCRRGFIRLYDDWLTLTSLDDGPSSPRTLPM